MIPSFIRYKHIFLLILWIDNKMMQKPVGTSDTIDYYLRVTNGARNPMLKFGTVERNRRTEILYNQTRVNFLRETEVWKRKTGRSTTGTCKLCGEEDDAIHCISECPRSEAARREAQRKMKKGAEVNESDMVTVSERDIQKNPEKIIEVLNQTTWMLQ